MLLLFTIYYQFMIKKSFVVGLGCVSFLIFLIFLGSIKGTALVSAKDNAKEDFSPED